MTGPAPAISINALRTQCYPNPRLAGAISPIFHGGRRYHASPTRGRQQEQQEPQQQQQVHSRPFYPAINTDSLSETLRVHREANHTGLIRKVYLDPLEPEAELPAGRGETDNTNDGKAGRKGVQSQNGHDMAEYEKRHDRDVAPQHPTAAQIQQELDLSDLKELSFKVDSSKGQTRQYPWLDHLEGSDSRSGLSRLNEEIQGFQTYMSSIPPEDTAALHVQQQVSGILTGAGLPNPLPLGSRQTGMALRHSSIDLLLPIVADTHTEPENPVIHLSQTANALNTRDFSNTHYITSGIPCVRSTHSATGLTISIYTCKNTRHLTSPEYTFNYLSEYPTLLPLYTTLRMILETRSLFGLSNQTISPHGLTMMIVAALKLGEGTYDRHTDVGAQLLYFLRFYADMDFRRHGISIDPPGLFRKQDPHARKTLDANPWTHVRGQVSIGKRSLALREDILCLQDPADSMNDLGAGCFRTVEMQGVFRHLYRDIQGGIRAWEERGDDDHHHHHKGTDDVERLVRNGGPGGSRISTASLIKQCENKYGVGLLQLALGANYNGLERLRDKTILGLGK